MRKRDHRTPESILTGRPENNPASSGTRPGTQENPIPDLFQRYRTQGKAGQSEGPWEPSQAFLQQTIVLLLVSGAVNFAGIDLLSPGLLPLWNPLLYTALVCLAWYFQARNQIRLALDILLSGVWLTATLGALYTGGIHSSVMVGYPLMIVMAGWAMGLRAIVVAMALSLCGALFLLFMGEKSSLGHPLPVTTATSSMQAMVLIVICLLAGCLAHFIVRSYNMRLEELDLLGLELALRAEELELSKGELDLAQAVGTVGSWVWEFADDAVRLTDVACRIFGLRQGAVVTLAEFAAPVADIDRPAWSQAWQAALEGTPFDMEHRITVAGEVRWIRSVVRLEHNESGVAYRAIGSVQDISERKRNEDALRKIESRWKFAVEGSLDGVWDWDVSTTTVVCSDRWKEIMGYAGADTASISVAQATRVHPQDQQRAMLAVQACLAGDARQYAFEARMRCKDGSYKWVLSRGMVVERDQSGAPLRMIGTTSDISERKRMEDQVLQLAFFDPLTGLPNRRLLDDRMQQVLLASRRSGSLAALMFLDLDNFKPINDTHGHHAGDALLLEVADRLKRCVRGVDTVVRHGGDEFVVMISDLATDLDSAQARSMEVAEKIRHSLCEPYHLTVREGDAGLRRVDHVCSVSIGVVIFDGEETEPNAILKRADQAMYRAKSGGRNAIRY